MVGLFLVGLGGLVLVVVGAGVYALVAVSRPPSHAPAATGPRIEGVRRVVGLGASLVHGSISASFLDRLRARLGPGWEVVNAGRNGELAFNAAGRVEAVAACAPDVVLVLIGSNDVMAALGPAEERRYRRAMGLRQTPSLEFYRDHLERTVERLRVAGARVALCSLPPLGEDLDSAVNHSVRRHNEAIRAVAREHGAHFIDLHELVAEELRRRGGERGRDLPRGVGLMLRAAVLHAVLGWSFSRIGRKNGFLLLSDGIHLGEEAAELVAGELERQVRALAAARVHA
jgi:lysophospholipase L1-like esterase